MGAEDSRELSTREAHRISAVNRTERGFASFPRLDRGGLEGEATNDPAQGSPGGDSSAIFSARSYALWRPGLMRFQV